MAVGSGVRHAAREGAVWVSVIVAGFLTFFYLSDVIGGLVSQYGDNQEPEAVTEAASSRSGDRMVAIRADRNGHFSVSTVVNGRRIEMLADTGATLVVLRYEDAQRLGYSRASLRFDAAMMTANGRAKAARITLDRIRVGDITVHHVDALVAEPDLLSFNLLGMSFIRRLSRFELRGRQLVLFE